MVARDTVYDNTAELYLRFIGRLRCGERFPQKHGFLYREPSAIRRLE